MPPHAPSDVRRGLSASTWEGAFAQVFITLTGGVFLIDFARHSGADEATLGVLAAIPFLAQVIQVVTGAVYERAGPTRASITAWTLLLARVAWVVPVALALGWGDRDVRLPAYLAVVLVSALLATAGAHGWTVWMGELVPPRLRGRYFGFRQAVGAGVALAAAWGGGHLLDGLEARREGTGFAAVYVIAAGAGVLAFLAMLRQHHPTTPAPAVHPPFAVLWREVWVNREHRRMFRFFFVWNMALGVSVPFWADYMRRELHMNAWEIGLQSTIGGVVGLFLAPAWGRVVDRVGARPVLIANAAGIAGIPFLWLACGPDRTWPVWIDSFVVGVLWTGFNLTAFNVPLSMARARGGAVFLGVFSAVTGLAMGLSSIAAGFVARALGPGPHRVLGLDLAVHQVMFLASGLLRVLAVPWALALPDPKDNRVIFLFQVMGFAVRHRLNLGRQILTAPWRRRP